MIRRLAAAVGALGLVVTVAACRPSADERSLVDLLNGYRAEHGLRAVRVDDGVQERAQAWAYVLSFTGDVEHSDVGWWPGGWSARGENVALGPEGVSMMAVARALESSPSHRANLLGRWDRVGVGVVRAGGLVYVVQEFER